MTESTCHIDESDMWWVREIYFVLCGFADDPDHTISRLGSGEISVPDDQANHLSNFVNCLHNKYPGLDGHEWMRVAAEIETILARRSASAAAYDPDFWTNEGFRSHPDWLVIRELSRRFLIR